MDISQIIAEELQARKEQVDAAVTLIDEGNTIPFIARYRKEATGGLDDEQLRLLFERLNYLRNLEERKQQVLASIEEQGKLTPELSAQIAAAQTLVSVEDLYRPFKPKRRTRATVAREKGLEPLAKWMIAQDASGHLKEEAAKYIDAEKEVVTVEEAIAGACDIIAEDISDNASYREHIRKATEETGRITSKAKDEEESSVYEMYYDFEEPIAGLPGHRVLAINRGEKEKFLNVKITAPRDIILEYLKKEIISNNNEETLQNKLVETIEDAYDRLIAPSIEREVRSALTETAQEGAIHVFGENLKQLLMQPPIVGKTVLGWDPAFRTGCKLAVVDETGKVLDHTVIFPTEPQNRIAESKKTVESWINKYNIDLISVGNGTASRESEAVIAELISEIDKPVQYVIVNEAGASVYSASKLATEEFPEYDVGTRSAASIARRLQDPLAELVKIDPKSIGVGQYQHDMNQKKLGETLTGVVESSVNRVGVDLNTASYSLLSYVSGISKTVAKNIIAYREENGSFKNRRQLLSVAKLGPKAFTQCAGFLRIRSGDNPLDATGVHPESYDACEKLLEKLGHNKSEIVSGSLAGIGKEISSIKEMAEELSIGEPTLLDMIGELEKPGRDPRDDMPRPILRSDVMEISDLQIGMVLKGTVRNIVDFGAFVDIGVHQDGLVHISRMTKRFIKHPLEVVSVGDIVDVEVVEVDADKGRIGLSMLIGEPTTSPSGQTIGQAAGPASGAADSGKKHRASGKPRNNGAKRRGQGQRNKKDNPNSFGSSLGDLLKDLTIN